MENLISYGELPRSATDILVGPTRGATLRLRIMIQDVDLNEKVRRQLAFHDGDRPVSGPPTHRDLILQPFGGPFDAPIDAVILDLASARRLLDRRTGRFLHTEKNATIVFVVRVGELPALVDFSEYMDGLILVEENLTWIFEIVFLAIRGIMVIPQDLMAPFKRDRLRIDLVGLLSPAELKVFHCLGTGSTNLQIAARLGVSESNIKSYVRSVLASLKFHNRCEAAVFYHSTYKFALNRQATHGPSLSLH